MKHLPVVRLLLFSWALVFLSGCGDEGLLGADDQGPAFPDRAAPSKNGAPKAVPFDGIWINTANPPVAEPPAGCEAYFTTSAVGRATHLGALTSTGATCAFNVRIVEEPPFNFTGGAPPFFVADFSGEMTWTAANGDQLFLSPNGGTNGGTFVQSMTDWTSSIVGSLSINGGTGRFEGATGQADVRGTGDADVDRLSFEGWIVYDAARRHRP